MLRVAVKGVLARKLRLLLTSVAVVLGVGFVAGAFFLTDSLRTSFDSLFTEAARGIDVHIQSAEYRELAEAQATSAPGTVSIDLARVGVPPDVIDSVEEVDGVEQVAGTIFEVGATVLDKEGRPLVNGGAPSFGANWVEGAEEIGALRIVEGRAPERGEVLLDATMMERGGFEVGERVRVGTQAGRQVDQFEIAGVVRFGDSNNLNGASITVFETTRAQELFDMGDRFTAVEVRAEEGVSQAALQRNVARVLGPEYVAITGAQYTQEQTEAIDEGFLGILQNVILGFAAVAVFVGAFTIFNTFTILVGQRTREIGLLRAVGAGRRQILGIVVLEALVTGLVASTLGILAGYGIAAGLRELINAFADGGIPEERFPLRARTVIASYAVGVLVTLLASLVPAWRASRLSPLEALRANPALAGRGWRAPAVGVLLLLVGGLLVYLGFTRDDASISSILAFIGGGFAVAIVGLALLSRVFILPVTRMLAPLLGRGTTGALATRNVLRNRARSATTASALMIGLALASLVLVFQSSLRQTIEAELDRTLGADISVYNSAALQSGAGFVRDEELAAIEQVEGVEAVGAQYFGGVSVGEEFDPDEVRFVAAFDDEALADGGSIRLVVLDGDRSPQGEDGILVDDGFAREEQLSVGDEVDVAFSTGMSRAFRVDGVFEPNEFVGAPIVLTRAAFFELQPPAVRAASFAFVSVEEGQAPRTVGARIREELGRAGAYLEVQDTEQLRETFDAQLAPVLGLVLGMLSLSLVIALFGIGNTLALNVFERTREIGLLRAVGGTQRQLRRIIRVEAVFVAMFGAIVGILVGIVAGRALIAALESEGFEFSAAPLPLLGVLFGGFLAGVLASVVPARRAARTDVLEAIATE